LGIRGQLEEQREAYIEGKKEAGKQFEHKKQELKHIFDVNMM
jgi:hypothetical protein